jgi:hypothetical protein
MNRSDTINTLPLRSFDLDAARRRIRAQSIVGTSPGRNEHDFYPTPPSATEALLSVERFNGEIWECACGDGAISKVLEAYGYKVRSSDLVDRGYGLSPVDFLRITNKKSVANVVTNPPYSLAEEFVRMALDVSSNKVAMLLKLTFLESEKRRRMFESTPLARVHVFSKRLTLMRNGAVAGSGGMIAFAWFVWEHRYTGRPQIGWLCT